MVCIGNTYHHDACVHHTEAKRFQQSTAARSGQRTQSNNHSRTGARKWVPNTATRPTRSVMAAPTKQTDRQTDRQTDTQSRTRTETYARSNSSGSGSPLTAPAASRTSASTQITGAHGPRPIPLRSRVTAEPPPGPPPLPRSRPASRGGTHERLNAARLPSPARRAARRGTGSSSVARGSGGGLGFGGGGGGFLVASGRGNGWNSEPSGDGTRRRGRNGRKISGSDATLPHLSGDCLARYISAIKCVG
jgi:hypothetical protein